MSRGDNDPTGAFSVATLRDLIARTTDQAEPAPPPAPPPPPPPSPSRPELLVKGSPLLVFPDAPPAAGSPAVAPTAIAAPVVAPPTALTTVSVATHELATDALANVALATDALASVPLASVVLAPATPVPPPPGLLRPPAHAQVAPVEVLVPQLPPPATEVPPKAGRRPEGLTDSEVPRRPAAMTTVIVPRRATARARSAVASAAPAPSAASLRWSFVKRRLLALSLLALVVACQPWWYDVGDLRSPPPVKARAASR